MAGEQTNGVSPPGESGGVNGLTPIHRRIHCVATANASEGQNELDRIAIDHFLYTLAKVALAIIRRRQQLDQCGR